ncbi:hypothetical protein [Rhizobium lentis]|uniref:hypothetical protein n=1 Tax=Rhizobium lentis TaxID=1138194 RepID=UPI002180C1E6|nr:hypothetical protein [Rhizobium lentis]
MHEQSPAREPPSIFRNVSGRFFRSVLVERLDRVLDPEHGPLPQSRPACPLYERFAEWAIMAISGYMREDGRRRVVVPLSVGRALVLDQHAQQACECL